jgi:hypothetical protein
VYWRTWCNTPSSSYHTSSRWKRDEVGGVVDVADPVRWLARKQNPTVEEVMERKQNPTVAEVMARKQNPAVEEVTPRKQHPAVELRTRPRRRASSRYEPGRGVVHRRGVNPALASCVVDLRWAVGGGCRRVGDLSAAAGRVWRGRGGRVGDLSWRGRGTSWDLSSRFRDISGVGEGVRHRDISLAGGPRNEISAGDKMSWAGFGGKWGGVSRSSLGA